jgi:hypothetical protein
MSDKVFNCKPREAVHEFNGGDRCQCGAFTQESLKNAPPESLRPDPEAPDSELLLRAVTDLDELWREHMVKNLTNLYNEVEELMRMPGFATAARPLLTTIRKIRKLRGMVGQ